MAGLALLMVKIVASSLVQKARAIVAMTAAVLLLSACETPEGQVVGLEQQRGDSNGFASQAPLTVPPSFGDRPSTDENAEDSDRRIFGERNLQRQIQAEAALRAQGATRGDIALLNRTEALLADPSIRAAVNEESSAIAAKDDAFVDRLVFWEEPANSPISVDADSIPEINREGEGSWFEWPF